MEREKKMSSEYIIDGSVASENIVYDIKNRKLKESDIRKLAADPKISASFIGTAYNKKKPRRFWNKSYLESLLAVAVAESFNLDYLLYLDEVAEFVSKAAFRKVIAGGIIALVIIAGVIVYKYF